MKNDLLDVSYVYKISPNPVHAPVRVRRKNISFHKIPNVIGQKNSAASSGSNRKKVNKRPNLSTSPTFKEEDPPSEVIVGFFVLEIKPPNRFRRAQSHHF
jgi:hypothetical protein